jgi:endonuclease YncB( thermonuclease family)
LAERLLLLAAAVLPIFAPASELLTREGRVISVADGDTFTLLLEDNKRLKVPPKDIDAPESGQPYGNRSKQAQSDLIFGKDLKPLSEGVDRYNRLLATVFVGDVNVNKAMVKQGAARVYRQYVDRCPIYDLEAQARAEKSGLWVSPKLRTNLSGSGVEQAVSRKRLRAATSKVTLEKAATASI